MQFFSHHPRRRRYIGGLLFAFLFFQIITIGTLSPQPTDAFFEVSIGFGPIQKALDKVKEVTWKVLKQSVTSSFYRMAMNFAARMGQGVGKGLAEGGKGGKPAFNTDDFNDILGNAGEAAMGDALDAIGEGVGLNLCLPPNLRLNIGLSLLQPFDPPKPKCTFSEFKDKWGDFEKDLLRDPNAWQRIGIALNPSTSEAGIAMQSILQAEAEFEKKKKIEEVKYAGDQGWEPVTQGPANTVITPAGTLRELNQEWAVPKKPGEQEPKLSGDLWSDAAKVALYNFFTTYINSSVQQLLQGGIFPQKSANDFLKNARNKLMGWGIKKMMSPLGKSGGGTSGGQRILSFSQTGAEVDLMTDLPTCPEKGGMIYNCIVDANFTEAIRAGMSVREAMDAGKLRKDWLFGFKGENAGLEPATTEGYSYTNMKKLRRLRILPIGWELAAEVINDRQRTATLQEVVDGFDAQGSFYRLVDPNWILKAPLYYCASGDKPGQILQYGTAERAEYCADLKDCVVPTEDGTGCKTWGNCLRERNVWRFTGQSCEPQFNTCTSYSRTKDGASVAYNRNTVAQCPANAVGCRWYSTRKNGDNWVVADDAKMFFNRKVEACSADAVGCRQYLRVAPGANLIVNGSFELDDDANGVPDGWSSCGRGCKRDAASVAHGSISVSPGYGWGNSNNDPVVTQESVPLVPNTLYTFSASLILPGGGSPRFYFSFSNEVSQDPQQLAPGVCSWYTGGGSQDKKSVDCHVTPLLQNPVSATPQRIAFPLNPGDNRYVNIFIVDSGSDRSSTFDAIQLEMGNRATVYKDYGATNSVTLKPDAQGKRRYCRGDTENGQPDGTPVSPPKSIDANVGCEQYTPEGMGGMQTTAVLTSQNRCPFSCVGYDSFTEVETPFRSKRDPVYFIPSLAESCSADSAGCEEFTNLAETAKSGEAREYYTSLRHCQAPATDSQVYFMWSGTGLTPFTLKASNLDSGKAPCTNRRLADNTCVDSASPENRATCVKGDMATNPDCREFYFTDPATGKTDDIPSYRLFSRTIVSDAGCVRYRMSNPENRNTCEATGGAWEDATSDCIYSTLPRENGSCSAAGVGCRKYKGTTADAVETPVLDATFEAPQGGVATLPTAWYAGAISNESFVSDGKSVASQDLGGGAHRVGARLGTAIKKDSTYLLSFWAKGSGNMLPAFTGGTAPANLFARNTLTQGRDVQLTSGWLPYTLGPLVVTWTPDADEKLEFNSRDGAFFLDNVQLRAVSDDFFFKSDSWVSKMPQECLKDNTGAPSDSYMKGCRAYTDRGDKRHAVRSFSRTCKAEFVGCEAMIDTQNSLSLLRRFQTAAGTTADDVIVPNYEAVYMVNDPALSCPATEKGCTAFGEPPTYSHTTPFNPTAQANAEGVVRYWKNDPDKYAQILCLEPDLGCEGYANSRGEEAYFKDPEDRTCEWRRIPGTTEAKYGWFKSDKSMDDPDSYCGEATVDGSTTSLGYVRACDAGQDRCTRFIDPQDFSGTVIRTIVQETFDGSQLPPRWGTARGNLSILQEGKGWYLRATNTSGNSPSAYASVGLPVTAVKRDFLYRATFWAKGSGGLSVWFVGAPSGTYFTPAITLTNEWQPYQVGLTVQNWTPLDNEYLIFEGGPEFSIDKVDLSEVRAINDDGRSYYFIDDDALQNQRKACNGAASEKEGCILFRNTNKLGDRICKGGEHTGKRCVVGGVRAGDVHERDCHAKGGNCTTEVVPTYNSALTYRDSENATPVFRAVSPTPCSAGSGCDANDLLKVRRDRACGEWLTCLSGSQVYDKKENKVRNVCYAIGSCTEASPFNADECSQMRDPDQNPQPLTKDIYQTRNVTWSGQEYAGYSIPHLYPVTGLNQIPYSLDPITRAPTNFRLSNLQLMLGPNDQPISCTNENMGRTCGTGPDIRCLFRGQTLSGTKQCYRDRGIGTSAGGEPLGEVPKSCREYPESDSPFPWTVVEKWTDKITVTVVTRTSQGATTTIDVKEKPLDAAYLQKPVRRKSGFEQANIAQQPPPVVCKGGGLNAPSTCKGDANRQACTREGGVCVDPGDADCSYWRTTYTDGETRFWPIDSPQPSIITDGPSEQESRPLYGRLGYCLEDDPSLPLNGDPQKHPCFTWFPVDLIAGEVDVNAVFPEAEYVPASDKRFYCIETAEQVYRKSFNGSYKRCPESREWCLEGLYFAGSLCDSGGGCSYHCHSCSLISGPEGWYILDKAYRDALANVVWSTPEKTYGWDSRAPPATNLIEPKLRTICTKLALVVDESYVGSTSSVLAWTERLKGPKAANQRIYTLDGLNYIATTPNDPYGVVDAGAIQPDPAMPDAKSFSFGGPLVVRNENGQMPAKPNAGSAYASAPISALDRPAMNLQRVARREIGFGDFGWRRVRETVPLPAQEDLTKPSLYPSAEARGAIQKLQQIYARGFGVWSYSAGGQGCVKYCQGGVYQAVRKICDPTIQGDQCPAATPGAEGDFLEAGTCVAAVKKVCQNDLNKICTHDPDICGAGNACITQVKKICAAGSPSNAGEVCTSNAAYCNAAGDTTTTSYCQDDPTVRELRKKVCSNDINIDCTYDASVCDRPENCNATSTILQKVCEGGQNAGVDCKNGNDGICYDRGSCDRSECPPPVPHSYAPIISTLAPYSLAWDYAGPVNPDARGPEVRAARYDRRTKTYVAGQRGITVDTQIDGVREIKGSTAKSVAVKFYAYNESGNQMPLRRVVVDWGDRTDLSVSLGAMKNHKAQCRRYCSFSVTDEGEPTLLDPTVLLDPADARMVCVASSPRNAGANCTSNATLCNAVGDTRTTSNCVQNPAARGKACAVHSDCVSGAGEGFCNTDTGRCAKEPAQCVSKNQCGTATSFCRGGKDHGKEGCTPVGSVSGCAGDPTTPNDDGVCVENKCLIKNFGDEVDGCMQDEGGTSPGYYVFTHIYRCQGVGSPGWDAARGGCAFKPRVHVVDNWGWCNGKCETNADGSGRGCYNDPAAAGTKPCEDLNDPKVGTPFAGEILLKPQP